jgi:hypothetical protein
MSAGEERDQRYPKQPSSNIARICGLKSSPGLVSTRRCFDARQGSQSLTLGAGL